MKINDMLVTILLFTVAIFLIFNYMPSLIDVSALENERLILLQVLKKNNEFEQKLLQEKTVRKVKSVPASVEKKEQLSVKGQAKKKIEGNRGYLIKDGKPQF